MTKMTKILLLNVAAASSLFALNYEYPQLYKDPKVMGMGGANVAVGGHASALFYNPAALSYIPREYGIEVELINLSVGINENILNFIDDMDDATSDSGDLDGNGIPGEESDDTIATLNVIEKYMGKNIHLAANDFTSISKKGEKVAFAVGGLAGANLDFRTHRGFGSAGLLEAKGMVYYGAAGGFSYDFSNVELFDKYILNDFSLGLGLKQITYQSIDHSLTVAEIVGQDDIGEYILEDIAKDGMSTALDLGATYKIKPNVIAGLSILNIGGVGDRDAVYIPMTVNAGIGYLKRWEGRKFFNQVRLAADYVDMTNGYEQDTDIPKRTRLGLEANVWDGWFSTLTLRTGLYQGSVTYGANIRLALVQIGYAAYEEEVGAYAGQDRDKRQMFNITFGW